MAAKKNKYRQYPPLTPSQIRNVEPKQLQIFDMSVFKGTKPVADTSTGIVRSQSSFWLTSYRKVSESNFTYEEYLNQKEPEFVDLLMQEDFSDSVRNETTIYLSRLRKGTVHKNDVNIWLEKLYLTHQNNSFFIMQLLRMIRCFSFSYFYPSCLTLAGLAVHHESDFVKSEALSLLDHWGNVDVFRYLNYHEPPETPWLRHKYLAIKDSLERYAAIQEDRRNTVGR